MKFVLALIAALGLLLGPVAASATTAECGMSVAEMAAMSGVGDAGSHQRQPCCPNEKACIAACALAALTVCAAPSVASLSVPIAAAERPVGVTAALRASLPPSTDTPPPRTLA